MAFHRWSLSRAQEKYLPCHKWPLRPCARFAARAYSECVRPIARAREVASSGTVTRCMWFVMRQYARMRTPWWVAYRAEKIHVERTIFRSVEDRLPVVAPLGDVMRDSGNDHSRASRTGRPHKTMVRPTSICSSGCQITTVFTKIEVSCRKENFKPKLISCCT
jgi:hypothetical protein